ncbi:alpha/beta fold hydrolase [Actinomadura parmotrematis]|uniref:Lipase family protein n=1 Tax=Actinomadura parmotrematis TaxID=2864039 RepID=A0ABS7FW17_9ACTN|nr:alpha/beta fold hydrolase [Actinomadura parmotrematis]MBW8484466.1 lipase family protein [Actinomadura parmotrematis]
MRRLLAAGCALLSAAALAQPATARAAGPKPGGVTAVAPLPANLWLPGTGSAQRLTYTTTGPTGKSAVSTGAVFVPKGTAPEGGWPVLSWTHGTVGIGDACAPSTAGRSDRDITYLKQWLAQGYAIVATDYVGLGTPGVHPYLDGRSAAYSAADMVRAARSVDKSLASKWVVIGQSQGGQAALFTANLAPKYAPELDFRGAVATGPPSNLEGIVSLAGPYIPNLPLDDLTGYVAYILAGLRAARPDFDVDRYLTPLGKKAVADAETLCYDDMVASTKGVGIGQLLNRSLFDAPFFNALRGVMEVPVSGYTRPFYIAQGMVDTTVPIPLTLKLVADLKARNQPVTFKAYAGADHSGNMAASLPDTTKFVANLFK